jgi:hypothetical protein
MLFFIAIKISALIKVLFSLAKKVYDYIISKFEYIDYFFYIVSACCESSQI